MKRVVFLVDKNKKSEVEKFLNDNGITFSYDDRFHFDIRTSIVTTGAIIILALVALLIF